MAAVSETARPGSPARVLQRAGVERPTADLILSNGKIATVDEAFRFAQAVAVRGDRIVAVGSNQDVEAWAGPGTRRIDLAGRTVLPGLIDNHLHLMRAGTNWPWEVRWDGVGRRSAALDLLRAKAKTTAVGEWIYILGGWTIDQFADDARPFTREELDRVVPDHPVLLQASYFKSYVNSRAARLLGVEAATGVVDESDIRALAARLPVAKGEQLAAGTRQMLQYLNQAGLTSVGSAACEPDVMPVYRTLAASNQLNVRVFCITGFAPGTPQQVDEVLPGIARTKLFGGDTLIDTVAYGETVYGPLHDPMFVPTSRPQPDQLAQWRRVANAVASAGLTLHVHANLAPTIGAFLDQIEAVNAEHPIGGLRWTLAHVNQIQPSHLARMKRMGMFAAVHPWAVINGGINHDVFGAAAADMAPLETIQESGVPWGLGSDGSRANQIRPFVTLAWAVTGQMVGGRTVLRQPVSRQEALVAHTRSNAFVLFQESRLGSIEAGKLADVIVLDRDYFSVPAEQIKDIQSVLTIAGGRVVFDGR